MVHTLVSGAAVCVWRPGAAGAGEVHLAAEQRLAGVCVCIKGLRVLGGLHSASGGLGLLMQGRYMWRRGRASQVGACVSRGRVY